MRWVNKHLGYNALASRNTSFSNVNKARAVWWLNIDPRKFGGEFHILLAKDRGMIWLKFEANAFPNLESIFRIRADKNAVDLEIACGGYRYMRDIKSGGSGYDFTPHIQREWDETEYDVEGVSTPQAAEAKGDVIVIEHGDPLPSIVDISDSPADGPFFKGSNVPVKYMFEYIDKAHNLYAFLDDFPEVSAEQALEAMRERVNTNGVIHSDRDYVSGTPIFKGTRVPIHIMFEFLAAGDDLDEFLECFPSVSREKAVEALTLAKNAMESIAYETASR